MASRSEIDEALQESLRSLPQELADPLRSFVLSTDKRSLARVYARLVFASSDMVSLPKPTAMQIAISLELIHGSNLTDNPAHSRTVLILGLEKFLGIFSAVDPAFFPAGFQRLLSAAGSQTPSQALIAAAVSVPQLLAGIPEDSSQALALDIFAKEFAAACATADSLAAAPDSPSQAETKRLTVKRLNSATLSLSSAWSSEAASLIRIAEELSRNIQAIGSDENT